MHLLLPSNSSPKPMHQTLASMHQKTHARMSIATLLTMQILEVKYFDLRDYSYILSLNELFLN